MPQGQERVSHWILQAHQDRFGRLGAAEQSAESTSGVRQRHRLDVPLMEVCDVKGRGEFPEYERR